MRPPAYTIEVLKPIRLGDEDRYISITPAETFSIRCEIDFDHPALGYQSVVFDPLRSSFRTELARARTFCRESDVESILAAGMGRGGSLENTVVIGDDGPLNEEGLRYADECARHKALDCFGDLYLAGAPILGHVRCLRSGHGMNHALLSALLDDPAAWRLAGAEQDAGFGEPGPRAGCRHRLNRHRLNGGAVRPIQSPTFESHVRCWRIQHLPVSKRLFGPAGARHAPAIDGP